MHGRYTLPGSVGRVWYHEATQTIEHGRYILPGSIGRVWYHEATQTIEHAW